MPKRPRQSRPRHDISEQEGFIPKPPPRKSVERPIPESIPEPSQNPPLPQLAPTRAKPINPNPLGPPRERPSFLLPGPAPFRLETGGLVERLQADIHRMQQRKAQEPQQSPGNELIVPMVCAPTKQPFMVRFTRASPIDQWQAAEIFLVGDGHGTAAQKVMKVPVHELNWRQMVCPGCGQGCGPILCNDCQRLGCDGGIAAGSLRRIYRCSCGSIGSLESNLEEVSAAKGARAQEPNNAKSSSSLSQLLRLPKPR